MEVFAAAPPCPSVFELAAAEVAAVCVGRGATARSAATSAVARSRPVTGSAPDPCTWGAERRPDAPPPRLAMPCWIRQRRAFPCRIIPGSVIAPDTPYHGQIRARGAQIGGRVRRLVASYTPSTVASTPAAVPYRIRRRRARRRSAVEVALDPCRAGSAQCRHRPPPRPLAALISEKIGSGYVVGYGVDRLLRTSMPARCGGGRRRGGRAVRSDPPPPCLLPVLAYCPYSPAPAPPAVTRARSTPDPHAWGAEWRPDAPPPHLLSVVARCRRARSRAMPDPPTSYLPPISDGGGAAAPPARILPSLPRPQPCRAGSADIAPAAARQ
uniref:Uncharacterized protein n=1 Tax=Oryza rufipogon TaxID=4529 RepID=A0A0E0QHU7_ORYRU